MNPELIQQVVSAAILAVGAWMALSTTRRSRSRLRLLGSLAGDLAILLFIRLIGPFGGWGDWFVWVWFAAIVVYVIAAFRAGSAWAGLPWSSEEGSGRRGELVLLSVGAGIVLVVSGALVIPGLLLT